MGYCLSCGTALPTSSRFCSSCGAEVKPPEPEGASTAVRIDKGRVDPLASTSPATFSPARKPAASASAPKPRGGGRGQTAPLASLDRPPQPTPSVAARAGRPAVQPAAPAALGARVLVQWANGQRYPGVVEQRSGIQSLVRFDTGELRWVETRYVLPA